ncbi:hypothetical protein ACQ1P2_03735 [Ornithobacterium rhinotracheale]|uniref:hypothetical protein n=1 Tax=Ornithobacterium rhinotracheale TaxID=28251 RepID=UPI001FF313B1|nr:hypothetical protein [Ornithobacterium rhinotracheale]MCK0200638.1 hypothetical protein [Ornithobacterium rhinotracheale]
MKVEVNKTERKITINIGSGASISSKALLKTLQKLNESERKEIMKILGVENTVTGNNF